MSETPPTVPPSQGPGPTPPASAAPLFDPKAIADAFVRVLTRPAEFWASVRDQKGFGPPLVFAVVMGLVAGLMGAILAVTGLGGVLGGFGGPIGGVIGVAGIITTPIIYAIGCFIGGGIVYLIALVAGGKADYEQSLRIAGYANAVGPITMAVAFVPFLGIVPSLYGLYLVALGVIAIEVADRRKTFIAAGVLAGILVVFQVVGFFTAMAARSAADKLEAQYGAGSEFQRNMQRSTEELQRMSEQMQKAAEEARKNAEKEREERR
jgi:hypothetical protein